ncbi:hypothetical protein [Flavobacterium sp.]|uniref:hypothetical protein n=1 Tax=Flavobacterium sp. TaxID=239 RepID=UPI004047E847
MKNIFKLLLLLILIPWVVLASDEKKAFNKEKTISKTFEVNNDALLSVTNSYGNVNVYLWDENKISIQVQIKVSGNNEKKVTDRLNDIDITFAATSNKVGAITEINGKNWQGNNNISYEINYVVKIPKNGNVDLHNKYGNISIDKLNGNLGINCKYGSLFLGQLNGKLNNIIIAYSQNSTITSVDKLNLNSQYSEVEIQKGNQINIDGNYNTFEFQSVGSLNITSNYTKVKTTAVSKSVINGNYLTLKLGDIGISTTIKSNYSDIQLGANKNTNAISIDGNYTNSKITCTPDYAFDVQVELKYGSFKDALGIKYTDKYEKNTSKSYTGYHIAQGKSKITVATNYGSLQLLTK